MQTAIQVTQDAPPAVRGTVTTPVDLLRIAVESGADLDKLERLMALQERWEKANAAKDYSAAFALFKAEAVELIRDKTIAAGPLQGKKYAGLAGVVEAITPALTKHNLSASWHLTKDEPGWLEVACTLKHVGGHSETVTMGGPPDAGGAKNAIQARASTVSYLQRYTLKAICGVAEADDDNDGSSAGPGHHSVGGPKPKTDRTAVMKHARQIAEHITNERDLGALQVWEEAVELGDEFATDVWHRLTTPEQTKIRQLRGESK